MAYSNGNGNGQKGNSTSQLVAVNENANGHNGNKGNNGHNGNNSETTTVAEKPWRSQNFEESFESPILLRQSPRWSRAIIWGIVGVTTFTVAWAYFATIDEAVPAQGKLEPQGAVKEVQAPMGGVVKEVLVEEGEKVEQGEVLMTFDQTAPKADLESLKAIKEALEQENQYYRAQLNGGTVIPLSSDVKLSPEMATLTANRVALAGENQLYRSILRGDSSNSTLGFEQQQRLQANLADINSRVAERQLEVQQLKQQLYQVRLQLENAREIFQVNQRILNDIRPVYEQGGVARIQYLRQEQEANTSQTNVNRLVEEEKRLEFAIAQAEEQLQNIKATSSSDLLAKIEANQQRIAEIDSQVSRVIRQNEQRIAEIDSQLKKAQSTFDYQELRAPVDGIVFDLQASPEFVANTSEAILKLVPEEGLVARVFITNKDIGFVQEGMKVDVRIDSFPYSEFKDIKGKVIRVGSDALPPDEVYPYYRFPVEVSLDKQMLKIRDKEILLQSGMSVTANIQIRERRVIDIFTNLFQDKVVNPIETSR